MSIVSILSTIFGRGLPSWTAPTAPPSVGDYAIGRPRLLDVSAILGALHADHVVGR